ncbi:3-dehydroquinate synthase [Candidatus Marinamargulisbacteria bacterium SCGC AG-414-C22]|nr:3-dehydroquinate synthase [Candidatus Marinamargulisbacteria bacterium SCGC AG-414-C22]
MTNIKKIQVTLSEERDYTIYLGQGILASAGKYIQKHVTTNRYFIITHKHLYDLFADQLKQSLPDDQLIPLFVNEGESTKSISCVETLLTSLFEHNVERSDCVIGLGGGVIGDLAGFVASICLRGIRLIHIPTTLLAQVDSAIGGKTGVNHPAGKNLIGSFYQPQLILVDPCVLLSLPYEEMRSGFAEVIKYGVIMDKPLFTFLVDNKTELKRFNVKDTFDLWEHIIYCSGKNKASVVQQDEKESHLRATLNFGHTIGHALESMFGTYDFRHGECVAFGMICAAYIANQMKLLPNNDLTTIVELICAYDFKLDIPKIDLNVFFKKLLLDKKVKDQTVRFILPTSIGSVELNDMVSHELIKDSLTYLNTILR